MSMRSLLLSASCIQSKSTQNSREREREKFTKSSVALDSWFYARGWEV